MRRSAAALPLLVTLAACSDSANVHGAFVEECIANGNSVATCECAYEYALDLFKDEQLQLYRALIFNNERDLSKYKAQLGIIKATGLGASVALVEGRIVEACGRLRAGQGLPTGSLTSLSVCDVNGSQGAASTAQRARVLRVLRDFETTGDGVDALFEGWLSKKSTIDGVVWWDVFGILLTTQDMLVNVRDGDYVAASAVAADAIAARVVPQSVMSSTLSSASGVASLAGLPIEWAINAFALKLGHDAIANQIDLYARARDAGWGHQKIMAGVSEFPVVISDDGYITQVDNFRPLARRPFRQQIDRKELYTLAKIIYENENHERGVERAIASAIGEFESCLP